MLGKHFPDTFLFPAKGEDGLHEGGNGEGLFSGYRGSFGGDGNILALDGDSGCTTS